MTLLTFLFFTALVGVLIWILTRKDDHGSLELGIGRSEIVVAAAASPANASPAVLRQIQPPKSR
jgi:uncharacterized sodium:solute symporter family permease YidK